MRVPVQPDRRRCGPPGPGRVAVVLGSPAPRSPVSRSRAPGCGRAGSTGTGRRDGLVRRASSSVVPERRPEVRPPLGLAVVAVRARVGEHVDPVVPDLHRQRVGVGVRGDGRNPCGPPSQRHQISVPDRPAAAWSCPRRRNGRAAARAGRARRAVGPAERAASSGVRTSVAGTAATRRAGRTARRPRASSEAQRSVPGRRPRADRARRRRRPGAAAAAGSSTTAASASVIRSRTRP